MNPSQPTETAPQTPCGWTKLYHPSGAMVTLPVAPAPIDYAAILANVSAALSAGFLVDAPGLDAGEVRDGCGWVVRSQKDGRNGTADVIDLYLPDDIFAKCRCYLNNPDDVANFERVSGLVLAKLPLYVGDNKLERGKSRQTDQFIVKVARPFPFVWKNNPAHDPNETDAKKKKPKRVWVRWADAAPPAPAAAPPAGGQSPQSAAGGAREAFLELIERKGKTFTEVLVDIDRVKKTRYVESKATYEKVDPTHLASYAKWLEKEPDAAPAGGRA